MFLLPFIFLGNLDLKIFDLVLNDFLLIFLLFAFLGANFHVFLNCLDANLQVASDLVESFLLLFKLLLQQITAGVISLVVIYWQIELTGSNDLFFHRFHQFLPRGFDLLNILYYVYQIVTMGRTFFFYDLMKSVAGRYERLVEVPLSKGLLMYIKL